MGKHPAVTLLLPVLLYAAAMGEDYVDPFFTDSFVLGAFWLGIIRDILWIRPAWARQLPDGTRRRFGPWSRRLLAQ
jgi:hypothetical protein